MKSETSVKIDVPNGGDVSGLLLVPDDADCIYVLGHGAGAGMSHPFMADMANELYSVGVGTLRFQFPYMEQGRRSPGPPAIAERTVRAAVEQAGAESALPVVAGGKSYGGRMTSQAQALHPLPGVVGLVFLGFPLHAPNRPGDKRAAHLRECGIPMLFLQGTRDALADLELMRGVVAGLGDAVTLHLVDDADHSFKVPKRSGRSGQDVMKELATTIVTWTRDIVR